MRESRTCTEYSMTDKCLRRLVEWLSRALEVLKEQRPGIETNQAVKGVRGLGAGRVVDDDVACPQISHVRQVSRDSEGVAHRLAEFGVYSVNYLGKRWPQG